MNESPRDWADHRAFFELFQENAVRGGALALVVQNGAIMVDDVSSIVKNQPPNLVGNHFRVGKKLGAGSFGIIYEGQNLITHATVAIKFENRKSDAPQLANEYRSYKILKGCPGIPLVHYFGQDPIHNILCMDLQGQNLESMFDLCNRHFSIKTVAMLAKRMIALIQTVHEHNLIYRDIKPDNFLIGKPPRNTELQYALDFLANHTVKYPHPTSQIYLVDFGMAKQYRDPTSKVHIPYREKKSLSGTARYMSTNTHLGREQSRRDDLESLGHVFLYFLRGNLPWQGLKAATNKQKYEKIGEKKQSTSVKELCDGFPDEFGQYLMYARNLKFDQAPDYTYLERLFDQAIDDGVFDWMIEMERQLREREQRRRDRENRSGTSSNDTLKPDIFLKGELKGATSNLTLGTSMNGGGLSRVSLTKTEGRSPYAHQMGTLREEKKLMNPVNQTFAPALANGSADMIKEKKGKSWKRFFYCY